VPVEVLLDTVRTVLARAGGRSSTA